MHVETNAAVEGALRDRHQGAQRRRTAACHASFFLPYLKPGMDLLDLGCGPATITVGLAAAVAPGGTTGVDLRPKRAEGIERITIVGADVCELPFPSESFDAIFAHCLLQHLADPLSALCEARRVARPGAVIGVADADWDGQLLTPSSPVLERAAEVMERFRDGTSPRVGKQLRGLLYEAGFSNCEAQASVSSEGTPAAVRHFAGSQAAFFANPAFVAAAEAGGWASSQEMAEFATAWRDWGEHPGAFLARFTCQAIGWA